MAYLHPKSARRRASVVTLEPTVFLEVNPAALALSSDEVQERFNKALIGRVLTGWPKPTASWRNRTARGQRRQRRLRRRLPEAASSISNCCPELRDRRAFCRAVTTVSGEVKTGFAGTPLVVAVTP